MHDDTLQKAYEACLEQAGTHYENFPTASRLLSKPERLATAAIYSFARRADDFADEGDDVPAIRRAKLDDFSSRLIEIEKGHSQHDNTFIALADVIKRYSIPTEVLERLLIAFRMDVDKQRYANFSEVIQYCHCSADPIGELVLRLHNKATEENLQLSNRICSALQIINFIQDLDEDLQTRNRIYIPQDEMNKKQVTEQMLKSRTQNTDINQLMDEQLSRAKDMLLSGAPLINNLSGRLRWVIRLTFASALMIVNRLEKRQSVYERPVLRFYDWPVCLLKSLYFRPGSRHARIRSTRQSS